MLPNKPNTTRVKISVYRLAYVIQILDANLSYVIEQMVLRKLHTLKKIVRYRQSLLAIDKKYYIKNKTKILLPITTYKSMLRTLKEAGVDSSEVNVDILPDDYSYPKVEYEWNEEFVPRDYQIEYHDAILNNLNRKIYLIDLQTGMGKTLIMCKVLRSLGYKVAMIILPKYIGKWVDDFQKYLNVDTKEIYVVKGETSFANLVDMSKEELDNYKVFLFSISTMGYIVQDAEKGEYPYEVTLHKLLNHLGTPVLANDETHQHFYIVSRCLLYLNPRYFIGSTATLVSNIDRVEYIYKVYIPPAYRISNIVATRKYVDVLAVEYRCSNRHLRCSGKIGYSHIVLESSLMKTGLSRRYYDMITDYLVDYYMLKRKKGDRAAIYFASLDMIDDYLAYLLEDYEDRYSIGKYIGGEDYSKLFEYDIIVTNMPMAGTAVDIPNLIVCIQTVCVLSVQANLQNFGRLRHLTGKDTTYIYFYSRDIYRHRDIHWKRKELLEDRVKSWSDTTYPKLL